MTDEEILDRLYPKNATAEDKAAILKALNSNVPLTVFTREQCDALTQYALTLNKSPR